MLFSIDSWNLSYCGLLEEYLLSISHEGVSGAQQDPRGIPGRAVFVHSPLLTKVYLALNRIRGAFPEELSLFTRHP